eukprot:TRINITY_DN12860_c0_g1_i1.p1 TRINITY_DN12860_c0_g1~~TRINITY_DN12860_c0_g1_i1.p1  ORF type:complete len:376 (-),score=41.20 TRINITY_DN12860_c0_g1_i1:485-1612(-)
MSWFEEEAMDLKPCASKVAEDCCDLCADCLFAAAPLAEFLGQVMGTMLSPCVWPAVYCFRGDGDSDRPWAVGMEHAPCHQPRVCCCSVCCPQGTQFAVRHAVLDRSMADYKCFQGYLDGPYCLAVCSPNLPFTFKAGSYGDKGNACCLLLEVCCCPFISLQASREHQRFSRGLGHDPTEIRVEQCLNFFSCLADCCLCFGLGLRCIDCCAGCCLERPIDIALRDVMRTPSNVEPRRTYQESSERLGAACVYMAYGLIRGMHWILCIATCCLSAQMYHQAQQPKPARKAQIVGAPLQHEMKDDAKGQLPMLHPCRVSRSSRASRRCGPPVPKSLASTFLHALREEHQNGKEGAVQDVLDGLPSSQQTVLEPYRKQV